MENDDNVPLRIGINIRLLRHSKAWSQEELADRAKISLSTLRNREAGNGNPQYRTLQKIARVFEIEPRQLASLHCDSTKLHGKIEDENLRLLAERDHTLVHPEADETQSLVLAEVWVGEDFQYR